MDLGTVRDRDKLKPQREPYWQKLANGQHLGYRPSTSGKGGTWIARHYDPDTRKKIIHSLGDFGHLPPSERFTAASAEAREWLAHLSGGGSPDLLTVREACERYANSNPDAAKRFPRYVYDDPIAKVKLHKLMDRHVREWRARLESMPALVSRNHRGGIVTRPRATATVNRDMVAFRAALNMALEQGDVLTARAWKKALEPAQTQSRRQLYLDKAQRRALLDHLPPDAADFCRGLCLLPLRPGALAGLTVADFDARTSSLIIDQDKAHVGRQLLLPQSTAKFFVQKTADKPRSAPLFARENGKAWDKDAWKLPIKAAASAADLPVGTTAYTLRHSTITDLVVDGLDLLTVAQVSGTSVKMIEKHYGHLQKKRAAEALSNLFI